MLQKKVKELEENFNCEKKLRMEKESEIAGLTIENQQLFRQLQQERDDVSTEEVRVAKYLTQKTDTEKQVKTLFPFFLN